MNNLTTRKIVLGLLMMLVLAFSVQGTADALDSLTKSGTTDVKMILPGASHDFTFAVTGVQNYMLDTDNSVAGNQTQVGDVLTVDISGGYITNVTGKSDAFPSSTARIILKTQTELTAQSSISSTEAAFSIGNVTVACRPSGVGELTLTVAHTSGPTPRRAPLTFKAYAVRPDSDVQNLRISESSSTQSPSFRYSDSNSTMKVVLSGSNGSWAQVEFSSSPVAALTADWNNDGTADATAPSSGDSSGRLTTFTGSNSTATVRIPMGRATTTVTATIRYTSESYKVVYVFRRITLTGEPSGAVDTGSRTTVMAAVNGEIALAVTAKDGAASSVPIEGIEITFDVLGSSGSLKRFETGTYDRDFETNGKAKTDAGGKTTVYLVLGSDPGIYTVSATVARASDPIEFSVKGIGLTGADQQAASVRIDDGDGQSAGLDQALAKPLVVIVRNLGGVVLSNIAVTFTTDSGALSDPFTGDPGKTTVTGVTRPTPGHRGRTVYTDTDGKASVRYNVGDVPGGKNIYATINAYDGQTRRATFGINGAPSTGRPSTPTTPTNTITISPSSTTGTPGETETISVTSSPTGVLVTLSSTEFANTNFSPQSGITPFTSTLTLPSSTGSYGFFAFGSIGGATVSDSASVTVETTAPGTLLIEALGAPANGAQTVRVTVRDSDGTLHSGALNVTLTGPGTSRTVETVNGTGAAVISVPVTTGSYTLIVSATGYTSNSVTLSATGQAVTTPTPTPTPTPAVAAVASSIQISGPAARSGTVNQQLDSPLLVRVLDRGGSGVANARVIFRVISGRGKLSERGNGRAVGVQTDSSGYARANFTPTDGGTITVRASTDDISATVEFTITTGAASTTTTTTRDTGTTPGTISPVVHVAAASRPPMLWIDGGAIYALVGASPQRFASSVDNALNIAVAGGKVYWTEKTGESGGTINSANLDGTNVTELASIFATPMGIAVDTDGSKLYWTNSSGRIQSANLNGSRITNELQNLASPMDIALAGGNAYWTQYDARRKCPVCEP